MMQLNEFCGFGIDDRVDHRVKRVSHDVLHLGYRPAHHQIRHEFANLLHLIVIGAREHVDQLGICRSSSINALDQTFLEEFLREGQ